MNQALDALINDPTVGAIGLALGGTAIGLWLAAAWWAYADMGRRSTSELARLTAVAWVLLSSPALLPLSLPAYLLTRPQATVAERRAQRLFRAMEPSIADGRCSTCGSSVDVDWRRCPTCSTWLASACPDCGEWSGLEFDTCPWCAGDKAAGAVKQGARDLRRTQGAARIAGSRRVGVGS